MTESNVLYLQGLYLLDISNHQIHFYYQAVPTPEKSESQNIEEYNRTLKYHVSSHNYNYDNSLIFMNMEDYIFYFMPIKPKVKSPPLLLIIKADCKYPVFLLNICIQRLRFILVKNIENGLKVFDKAKINPQLRIILMKNFDTFKEANDRGECYVPTNTNYKLEEEDDKDKKKGNKGKGKGNIPTEEAKEALISENENEEEEIFEDEENKGIMDSALIGGEEGEEQQPKQREFYPGVVKKAKSGDNDDDEDEDEAQKAVNKSLFFKNKVYIKNNNFWLNTKLILAFVFVLLIIACIIFICSTVGKKDEDNK